MQAASWSAAAVRAHFAKVKHDAGAWLARLEGKELTSALKAVHACLDALWAPLLDKTEARLGLPGARPSWDSLTPVALLSLLRDCSGTAEAAQWENAEACAALLDMLSASWEVRLGRNLPAPAGTPAETAWENRSACRLLSLLSLALCKTVAVEDDRSFGLKLDAWRAVERSFGLARPALCAAVDAAGKATLLYSDVCAVSDLKLRMECARSSALWETRAQWEASAERVGPAAGSPRGHGFGSVKLFPQFVSPEGGVERGEGHGPRKELFALLGQQMLHGQPAAPKSDPHPAGALPPIFPYSRGARHHWFDPNLAASDDGRSLLRYCGWLLAQAVCNRSPLGITLPTLLFDSLLPTAAVRPSLASLAAFDPHAAASLQAVSKMGAAQYAELAKLEECVGTPKDEYVAQVIDRLVGGGDAGWQLAELRAGFAAVLPAALLKPLHFSAVQLAAAVCGSRGTDSDFSIREVFRVAEDDELLGCPPLREALWAVLDSWHVSDKRALLQFCTGSGVPPAPGTEVLSVQMPFTPIGQAETTAMAQMLPQAHTCDNILELPNYHQALLARGTEASAMQRQLRATIQDRFSLAVLSCHSYGLDEAGSASELRRSRAQPPPAGALTPPPHASPSGGAVSAPGSGDPSHIAGVLHAESDESIDTLLAGTRDVPQETAGATAAAVPLELDSLRSEPPATSDEKTPALSGNVDTPTSPAATGRRKEKRDKKERGAQAAKPAGGQAILSLGSEESPGVADVAAVGDGEETARFLREVEQEIEGGEAAGGGAPATAKGGRGPAEGVDPEALQAVEDELEAMEL
jgi:hypothetical protein